MTILFVADIVGQPGIEVVARMLPGLKNKFHPDLVIANGENTNNNGKGITDKIARRLLGMGIDLLTGGNHTWESRNLGELFANENRVLRPANYPEGNAGKGHFIAELLDGTKIAILNLQGRTFLYPILCPFRYADEALQELQKETRIIFVDFHAEATAEKIALGWYLDGRVSAVVGTHTHVQTADERVLPRGTAYITDAGMTGAHDSVIGLDIKVAIARFMTLTPKKPEIANKNLRVAGVVVKIDKMTGKSVDITRFTLP